LKVKNTQLFIFWLTLLVADFAQAVPSFLESWQQLYPESSSGDVRCELCHAGAEGGDPWNAYGRDIRNLFAGLPANSRTIEQAITAAELLNSDEDDPSVNNISEINVNEQPGWRAGRNNRIYDRNDNLVAIFFPPLSIDPFIEEIETQATQVTLQTVSEGFTAPLSAAVSPIAALASQLFVVDQVGLVWRVNLDTGQASEYLDVSDRLVELGAFSPGGYDERGLLGFAFHPDFASNGRIYVYTSEPAVATADFSTMLVGEVPNHQSVITEIQVRNPAQAAGLAQVDSVRELLRIDQPQFNHNGGDLVFGEDGYLYIALGDGGSADDQGVGHGVAGNGSNPLNPLGAILRIDPLGDNSTNGAYGIPLDNPFVNTLSALDEIYAYGFRNPWKMSFDLDGSFYVTDVGQNDIEEVNRVESGGHYGWRFKEGSFFFDPNDELSGLVTLEAPNNLPSITLIDPLFEYDHDEGISIAGGHVYRGTEINSWGGRYVFADITKRVFIGDLTTGKVSALDLAPEVFIYALVRDSEGELYLLGNQSLEPSGQSGQLVKLEGVDSARNDDEFCVPIVTKSKNVSLICL